jgi:hypothetical protein
MNSEKIGEPAAELSLVKQQLNKAFSDFIDITAIYQSTVDKNTEISNKLTQLKEKYNDLIKTNTNKVFLFCLNSLYFQYKILNFELENFTKINSLIQNRMYGDYYKLYNIILSQCKENNILFSEEDFADSARMSEESSQQANDTASSGESVDNSSNQVDNENKSNLTETNFPVYKDVDPFFRYRIEDIILIHQRILIIINKLDDIYMQKEANIHDHKNNIFCGYSLSIFLNTLEYENELLKGQINLYMEYISFYHASQKAYLNNLLKKNTEFMCELDTNILVNMVSLNHAGLIPCITEVAATEGVADAKGPAMPVGEATASKNIEEPVIAPMEEEVEVEVEELNAVDDIPAESMLGFDAPLQADQLEDAYETENPDPEPLTEDTELSEDVGISQDAVEITCDDNLQLGEDIAQDNGSLDENPCGDVVIDNLSDNMLKAWQDGENC